MDYTLARCPNWSTTATRRMIIVSATATRWASHWHERSIVCPGKKCRRCRTDEPTRRIAVFARCEQTNQIMYLNLPEDPWNASPLGECPTCYGIATEIARIDKTFRIRPFGRNASEQTEPANEDDAWRMIAKLHRLPVQGDLFGAPLKTAVLRAAKLREEIAT